MIKRPKITDTEDDILQMQNEFLSEQQKSVNFQPAAKLVKVEPAKKVSKFAQERAKQIKAKENVEEKPSTSDYVAPRNIIIGNIVERSEGLELQRNVVENMSFDDSEGFPKPKRIDKKIKIEPTGGKSIFAQLHSQSVIETPSPGSSLAITTEKTLDFGEKSNIIENAEGTSIHNENAKFLQNLGEESILEEQKRLFGTMDPSLVQFLIEKRKQKMTKITEDVGTDVEMKEIKENQADPMLDIDVLKDENSKNWLHFDVIEPAKLEWMRDLPLNMPELKPGEQYEARFDWKGVLLPFNPKDDDVTSNSTELYLHGEDSHRPGYTLQELFRLARSTVVQQRISALRSVGGILSIYNQGYYDGIFELPISKLFFLLRYAFDDNTPAMLEESAKALSALFYNETDEVLLDMTYDCSFDGLEPTLEIKSDESPDKNTDIENQFSKLNINSNLLQSSVSDDDDKMSSMNDFHLAETDLIKCFLRTNILQRITYIITTLNLDNTTNLSCVKILIRLARTSREVAERILSHSSLIDQLINQFEKVGTTGNQTFFRIQKANICTLKLFRILCTYGEKFIDQLRQQGLKSVLKAAIFVQENSITVETVKIQIEAARCTRTVISTTKSDELIDELLPALHYTLEWIFQIVIFQDESHFLFRQCASALIALLASTNSIHSLSERLSLCFSKWFSMATQYGNLELSQVVLLATCLNAIKIPDAFHGFFNPYLSNFLLSSSYQNMCNSLLNTSGILSSYRFRQQDHKPLPHLHSIVYNSSNSPVFIVSDRPTIYFISSLLRFYNNTKCPDKGIWLNDGIRKYIEYFAQNTDSTLSLNWFLRHEILFVLDLLKSSLAQSAFDKFIQLRVAYKISSFLTETQINDVLHIFTQFIFNIDMYPENMNLQTDTFNVLKSTYGKVCAESYLNNIDTREKIENFDRIPMLSRDWPGMLLLKMYKTPEDSEDWLYLSEKDAIWATITFFSLQILNEIKVLSLSEQFVYTMIAFLGKEISFLEPRVKLLLASFVEMTFRSQRLLNFNSKFNGKFNFENLYIQFLDQFQASSYSDHTFSRLVMAPLAQKHNIKWRQMIWSEHIHVLRFVTCTEDELIGELNDYLEPAETDILLIKSYYQAINSNILLPNSAPFKIAQHHYNAYKAKLDDKKTIEDR